MKIAKLLLCVTAFALPLSAQTQSWTDGTSGGMYYSGGNVGIGTPTPATALHVFSTADVISMIRIQNSNATGTSASGALQLLGDTAATSYVAHGTGRTVSRWGFTLGGWNEVLAWGGNGLVQGTLGATPLVFGTNSAERLRIDSAGKVGIGTTSPAFALDVNGAIHASGAITGGTVNATYQDVAEWVPANEPLQPGTVVVLDRRNNNHVTESRNAYDTAVAGVVSAKPGVMLGEPGDDKAKIATTGRVKVHCTASAGPIAIGDLLVTSSDRGTAMISTPIDIGGVKLHRPGTVLGKALEPLASGEGDILVLLSLQ